MIDSTAIQLREYDRASIARAMAEFERRHGPVVTQPIRFDGKVLPFSISNPEKPRTAPKQSQEMRKLDGKRMKKVNQNTARRLRNVEIITRLAATGMKIADISAEAGITRKTVIRLMNDHGIPRSPASADASTTH